MLAVMNEEEEDEESLMRLLRERLDDGEPKLDRSSSRLTLACKRACYRHSDLELDNEAKYGT